MKASNRIEADVRTSLELRIKELEQRVKKLEEQSALPTDEQTQAQQIRKQWQKEALM